MVHVTSPTSLAVDVPQGRKLFVFDRVFPETVDQEGIWEYLSDSVNSFLQGYNVSILAYGQSGAGKSYTMGTSGPSEQNDPKAMGAYLPRNAAHIRRTKTCMLQTITMLMVTLNQGLFHVPLNSSLKHLMARKKGTATVSPV